MKNNLIIAIICLALGGAVAWTLKPSTPEPDSATTASTNNKKSPPLEPSRRATDTTKETPAAERLVEVTPPDSSEAESQAREQASRAQNRMQEMFKKRISDQMNARITKLASSLNLTPAQEQQLRDLVAQKIDELSSLDPNNTNPADAFAKLSELTSSDYLDKLAADLLTDEQKLAHAELKQRELSNQVEAKALKDLAGLSSLDLSPDQKDAAYDILLKQAEESVTSKKGRSSGLVSAFTEGLGIELDLEAFGVDDELIEGSINPSQGEATRPDPQEMLTRVRERQEQKVNQQVEALRPVLNDQQLQQYRQDLERRNSGFLGGILGGDRQE